MFELIDGDPPDDRVRRITFVPFLADGRCVLTEEPGGPALPSGEVANGEDYVLDSVLRIPLETAGFRYQRFHPFGLDGDHLYAWIEGGPYSGDRPHRSVPLSFCSAEEAAERLGDPALATAIRAAARSYRSLDEQDFYADNRRTLTPAYLRGTRPQEGSGFGGDMGEWRQARWHITEAITGDGTFLDVGCANGLLMESVAAWCAERGLAVEPYGVDISPELAELARRRALRVRARPARLRTPGPPRRPGPAPPSAYRPSRERPPAGQRLRDRPGFGASDRARDAAGPRLPLRRPDQRRRPPRPGAPPDRLDKRRRLEPPDPIPPIRCHSLAGREALARSRACFSGLVRRVDGASTRMGPGRWSIDPPKTGSSCDITLDKGGRESQPLNSET
jgi:hypothetical protein